MKKTAKNEIKKRCIQCRSPRKLVNLQNVSFGMGEEEELLVCEKCLEKAAHKIMSVVELDWRWDDSLSPLENCEEDLNLAAHVFHYLRTGGNLLF